MKDFLNIQRQYNNKIYGDNIKSMEDLERFTQELALCAHSEITSLVAATKYKKHHNTLYSHEPDRSKILYESVDVMRYIMAIMNLWNINEESFGEAFRKKDTYLNARKRIDENMWDGQPVAIIDIDDVLAEFREGFAYWLSTYKNVYPDTSSREYYFIDALKESGENPEQIFEEFIINDGFLSLLPTAGCFNFVNELKSMGYWVHLLTARPEDNLNCFYATYQWLEDCNILYDNLSFSSEKFRWCAQSQYYDKDAIKFAIDDSPKHAIEYATHGIECFVPMKPYNKKTWNMTNIQPYDSFENLLNLISNNVKL